MRRHIVVLSAIAAMALTAAVASSVNPGRQVFRASEPATISIERLHREMNPAPLQETEIGQPY